MTNTKAVPEMAAGLLDGLWTVAIADRHGWVTAGTGEPLDNALVATWTPLTPAGQSAAEPEIVYIDQRTTTDCLRACVATLTGADYDDVPDLHDSPIWRQQLREWARARDEDFTSLRVDESVFSPMLDAAALDSSMRIGIGPSPRGEYTHAVIIDASTELVHDPHLTKAGLAGPLIEVITWSAPYDPAPEMVFCIDADCPSCSWPERTFSPTNRLYGCPKCAHVSPERDL